MVFYEPNKTDHGLPYDPFKACVIPRPIGWISTLSTTGIPNLAPYSQFNNLTYDPPYVMFAANQTHEGIPKDSTANAQSTGVFCWNLATWDLREEVNASAEFLEPGVDEFVKTGLQTVDSRLVKACLKGGERRAVPMVEKSPVRFECEYHSTIRLPGNPPMGSVDVVIGKVVGVHIAEWALTDGKLDVRKTKPIARLGYYEYAVIQEAFEMIIPGTNKALLAGLEGSVKRTRAAFGDDQKADGKEKEKEEGEATAA
ncbi:hypothetical protein BT63DRAFT_427138 [Microthyrium microscopicum]|uniref:Flavin reductase like domain-containing protein n=1 Tax=Microthyrium microscopicum TaxID=703497 RepID=A0A6A6U480_9PEZI|nr:hypothetical protein BT63DRAFT_427138 [Microthyrium microscopicum]